MITSSLKLLARLPLSWFHRAGVAVGWLMYWGSPTYAKRVKENLSASGICSSERQYRALIKETVRETGKTATEWVKVWFASDASMSCFIAAARGWTLVDNAHRRGKGIIFLLPHLGSFQVVMRYIARRMPLTALYRLPKQRFPRSFYLAGSRNVGLSLAYTDLSGVQKNLQSIGDWSFSPWKLNTSTSALSTESLKILCAIVRASTCGVITVIKFLVSPR